VRNCKNNKTNLKLLMRFIVIVIGAVIVDGTVSVVSVFNTVVD